MAVGGVGASLEDWEVALVKAMLARGRWNDQEILAYFTRPLRTVNHRVIAQIRKRTRFREIASATEGELDEYLNTWSDIDPQTGLSLRGDELLIKAREAMIAAVHTFNGAGLTFRTELFIVTAVIGWTYLLHAYFRREGVDCRYKDAKGVVKTTKQGADLYWELGYCLRHAANPVGLAAVQNLEFLLELRHEIEHRSTNRLDDAVSAKLQACCINFNDLIKRLFGAQYALERRLPIALQFATFDSDQRALLKKADRLPPHIAAMADAFHQGMSEAEQADPAFAYRVAFIPKVGVRASSSDRSIEFIRPDSAEGREINQVLLKDVDKRRYSPTQIVEAMQVEGFPRFRLQDHTELWRSLSAKDQSKGFGKPGVYRGSWEWFDSWLARVRAHCQEQRERYI
jgi:hypothetical protein